MHVKIKHRFLPTAAQLGWESSKFNANKIAVQEKYEHVDFPPLIFKKLAKKRQIDFFYISEYEITRSLAPWKGVQSTSYLVVGSREKYKHFDCPPLIFRKLAKNDKLIFYISEYEITRSLAPWKGRQSTSYLVVGIREKYEHIDCPPLIFRKLAKKRQVNFFI